jgi:SAM-dependent methyltransferase
LGKLTNVKRILAKIGRDWVLFNPLFWVGIILGYYYSIYGMGHFHHGLIWVLLGIVPMAGLIISLTPRFTQQSFYRAYAKSLELKGGEHVIDFGCGDGKLSKQIAPHLPNGYLTCIDIDVHKIASAKKRLNAFGNVDIVHEDIRKLPKPNQTYDIVVAQMVFHDLTPQNREETIKSLSTWLDEGAVLYVREPFECIDVDELRQQLKKAGFKETNSTLVKVPFSVNFYGVREVQQLEFVYQCRI